MVASVFLLYNILRTLKRKVIPNGMLFSWHPLALIGFWRKDNLLFSFKIVYHSEETKKKMLLQQEIEPQISDLYHDTHVILYILVKNLGLWCSIWINLTFSILTIFPFFDVGVWWSDERASAKSLRRGFGREDSHQSHSRLQNDETFYRRLEILTGIKI